MTPTPAGGPWIGGEGRLQARAARRATDRLTVLMLVATAAVVAVAWFEPLQRLSEGAQAPAARRGIAQLMRSRGYAVGVPEPQGHPRIRGGALDPSNPLNRLTPSRDAHSLLELLAEDGDQPAEPKLIAKKPLTLRERADDSARVLVTIEVGGRVRVMRDLDEWLLLAARVGNRMVVGWVRREEVTLP